MNQYRFKLCMLLTMLLLAGAAGAPLWAANGPEVKLPETAFDFGSIDEGETVLHTFAVGNTGDAPLEILKIEAG